jgi:hypothetical protein
MIQTLRDMRETLKMAADVRSCAKHHPWVVTGLAAAVGFAAGAVLTPSPRKVPPRESSDPETGACQTRPARGITAAKRSWLFSTLGGIASGMLKNVAQTSIAAVIASQRQKPVEPPSPHDADAVQPDGGGPVDAE